MNCPICNKSGLPDYTANPVKCPQCNSDLKGFSLLEKTNSLHKRVISKQRLAYRLLLGLVIVAFSVVFFIPSRVQNDLLPIVHSKDSIIDLMEAELEAKKLELNRFQSAEMEVSEADFLYVIKKGDNLSKIALLFYNDWEMFEKIEEDNELESGSILFPNDTLIIKLMAK